MPLFSAPWSLCRLLLLVVLSVACQAAGPKPPPRSIAAGPDSAETPPPLVGPASNAPTDPRGLPLLPLLPDLLRFADARPVSTPEEWTARRLEIKAVLERYFTGTMPPAPGLFSATELQREFSAGGRFLYRRVRVAFGPGGGLALELGLLCPADGARHPFVIVPGGTPPGAKPLPLLPKGPNQGKGQNVLLASLSQPAPVSQPAPAAVSLEQRLSEYSAALERGYGIALFNPQDCAEDTTLRLEDGSWAFRSTRFPAAYPQHDWGVLAVWAWGMSRVADYLQTDALVKPDCLVVTGISRLGKAALIAAAFDERLMGAPVVSGGGGLGAFRCSGLGRGGREGLGEMMNKYPNWFSPRLRAFWGHVEHLPFDQHWLVALCAPRPFIALEGESDPVSLPNAVSQTLRGALPAYALYGQEQRLGLSEGRHGHVMVDEDWQALLDFSDQHLLGRPSTRQLCVLAAPPPVPLPKATFDVRVFGAVGDGVVKDTKAFQSALDACAVAGGGEVFVPAGSYLIGSIILGNRTLLRLSEGAVLRGSPNLEDYPLVEVRWEGRWQPGHRALIHASRVERVGIVGPGRIEGSPEVAKSQNPRGALVLEAHDCDVLTWDGFTVTQGGNWATHPVFCTNVTISNLTIEGARDGIDIDSCRKVLIQDCSIDTGDDAISLKSGRGLDGARLGRATEDVRIVNCELRCRRFACIGIGSEGSGGIRNVSIERCVFLGSATHALYIKSRVGRGGVYSNIVGEDLEVRSGNFLRVNLSSAGNTNTVDDPVPGASGLPVARDFHFRRVRVNDGTLVEAVQIPDEAPLRGFVLEDVSGACGRGISLRNVHGVRLAGLNLQPAEGPLVRAESCSGLGLEGAAALAPDAKR